MRAHVPRPRPRDLLLMLPVGVLVLGSLRFEGRRGPWSSPDGGAITHGTGSAPAEAYLLAVLAVAAIGLRRWPQLAVLLAAAATAVPLALGHPLGPMLLPVAITSWSLARRIPPPRSAVLAGIAAVVLVLGAARRGDLRGDLFGDLLGGLAGALPLSAWVLVPFSLGLARRLHLESRQRRRVEEQRQVLDAERLRLASEVHDVVGHGLAAIRLQADIALHVADRRPEQAREALEVISRASAEALAELRATIAGIAPETDADESRAATPGLERVGALCERMRETGIDVDLVTQREVRVLPAAADVAAYRIVQESLTNVVKHAAARHAQVRVDHGADGVEIRVRSAISPGDVVIEGFGIAGMRRRASDVGGSCTIAVQGSELEVRARLPYAA